MKTVVTIPTYNENENIERLLTEILALRISGHELLPLVIDDNSPDGTSQTTARLRDRDPRVHLMTRTTERGRGSAGIAGFKEALRMGADFIIEMDADFSHDPKYLPALITLAETKADIAIGSRFVAGGSDTDRGVARRGITKAAGVYIRTMLGVGVRDVSSGYRCFRRKALEAVELDTLVSTGPSILLEILHRASRKGLRFGETPIVFIDRTRGETKLNVRILVETLAMVARLKAGL